MNVIKSYRNGVTRTAAEGKMILLLWFVNALFAAAVYFLVSGYLKNALGSSAVGDLLRQGFASRVFLEMAVHKGGPIGTIIKAAFLLAFIFFWVSLFLNGGILYALTRSRKVGSLEEIKPQFAPVFFEGAGRYFGRFFRLSLTSLLLWIAAAVILLVINVLVRALTGSSLSEPLMFYLVLGQAAVGLFLFFLIRMICDYARIQIVSEDSRHVLRTFFQAAGFVFRRIGKTLGLYYLLLLTGLAIYGIYWTLQAVIPAQSFVPIILAFLVGQVFILSRGWLKVAFQASQLEFYSLARNRDTAGKE